MRPEQVKRDCKRLGLYDVPAFFSGLMGVIDDGGQEIRRQRRI